MILKFKDIQSCTKRKMQCTGSSKYSAQPDGISKKISSQRLFLGFPRQLQLKTWLRVFLQGLWIDQDINQSI